MVARKRNSKKSAQTDPLAQIAGWLTRADFIGVALILISVFTLLSLVTNSRGSVTGAWINGLERAFGIGVWGFPLIAAALGLWLVVRVIERMPNLPWQRPIGFLLLFIAFITGANLAMAPAVPNGGGWVGQQLAQGLSQAAGAIGAWAFVTFTTIAGILLLTDRVLVEGALFLWERMSEWRYQRSAGNMPPIQPSAPLPSGELPAWKRWREQLADLFSQDPAQTEQPPVIPPNNKSRMIGPTPQEPSRPAATSAPVEEVPRQRATAPREDNELLTPRIVGGAQEWQVPRLDDMLADWERSADNDDVIRDQGRLIQETLALFGVPADFEGAYKGPAVTQYLVKPGYIERTIGGERKRQKVKVSKIAALANDLALALAAPTVRIEAPIPGTSYVGVEVPNRESNIVGLKELMQSEEFTERKGKLIIALGEDVKGQPIVSDLARMPHLLIAGATGAGKSVCINSIITGLLLTHTPDTLRLLMVDPKMVELSVYNGVPHLLSPVVTEVDKAAAVLYWAVKEMERRYTLFSKASARDLERYNAYLMKRGEQPMPFIVIIVDEMADLMMAAPEEVEKHICRLAQMARAVGIHLIIATQRPSVDVITGLIKANFPARIAFAVTSQTDSRVILDVPGAERLLGRGDMLLMSPDAGKLERLQGTFLSDDEINRVVRYWKGVRSYNDPRPQSNEQVTGGVNAPPTDGPSETSAGPLSGSVAWPAPSSLPLNLTQSELFDQVDAMKSIDARDDLFDEAMRVVAEAQRGSVSLLQRKLRIGYNRASRLVDQLEEAGILGPDQGGSLGRDYLGDKRNSAREQYTGTPPDAPSNTTASTVRPASPPASRANDGTRGTPPTTDPADDDQPRIWF